VGATKPYFAPAKETFLFRLRSLKAPSPRKNWIISADPFGGVYNALRSTRSSFFIPLRCEKLRHLSHGLAPLIHFGGRHKAFLCPGKGTFLFRLRYLKAKLSIATPKKKSLPHSWKAL